MTPDDLTTIIHSRRSVRRFLPEPIPKDHVRILLDAARWAPSAGNAQPWAFFLVTSAHIKKLLVDAALGQSFLAQAPLVIVVCADIKRAKAAYGDRGATLYCLQDTAAAVQNILLTATQLGLGSCWVGAFEESAVVRALSLPEGLRPVAMVPVGKAATRPSAPSRRPLSDIVTNID